MDRVSSALRNLYLYSDLLNSSIPIENSLAAG